MAKPVVFDYLDYRAFISELFVFQKKHVPGFSHRYFARKAGFAAPNFLKLVMDGKRNLTPASLAKVARGFGLNKREREYFERLCNRKTITVGHTVKTIKPESGKHPKANVLFIGSANQSNIDALTSFIDEMFPRIRKSIPTANLLIAGHIGRVVKDLLTDNIIDLGEPESLDGVYDRADMVINPIKRSAHIAGRSLDLTPKEFDLLLHFAGNPGKVYTRSQLLDIVWGYGHDGYEHTVNSHINRLRAKIEKDPTNPAFIKTVWGVGYKFTDNGISEELH